MKQDLARQPRKNSYLNEANAKLHTIVPTSQSGRYRRRVIDHNSHVAQYHAQVRHNIKAAETKRISGRTGQGGNNMSVQGKAAARQWLSAVAAKMKSGQVCALLPNGRVVTMRAVVVSSETKHMDRSSSHHDLGYDVGKVLYNHRRSWWGKGLFWLLAVRHPDLAKVANYMNQSAATGMSMARYTPDGMVIGIEEAGTHQNLLTGQPVTTKEAYETFGIGAGSEAGSTALSEIGARALPLVTKNTLSFWRAGVSGSDLNEAEGVDAAWSQPKLSTLKQLKDFGLNQLERRSFYSGQQVIFEDPTMKFSTATIFHLDGDTLRAGIFDLISDGDKNALYDFSSRTRYLANSLGVSKLELFGADIQNPRLAELLSRRGFASGAPVKINEFGMNFYAKTLRKTYDLMLENEYFYSNSPEFKN